MIRKREWRKPEREHETIFSLIIPCCDMAPYVREGPDPAGSRSFQNNDSMTDRKNQHGLLRSPLNSLENEAAS